MTFTEIKIGESLYYRKKLAIKISSNHIINSRGQIKWITKKI